LLDPARRASVGPLSRAKRASDSNKGSAAMGVLIDGVWRADEDERRDADGRFLRPDSTFRAWITPDGAPGPTGDGGFKAEPGRYHLYVSLACPWASRALIYRKLKGLENLVTLSVTHWLMRERGWTFDPGRGVIPDTVLGARTLHEVYTAAKPDFTGRVTVPVLFDRKTRTIVNNESSDIIRMFNSCFDSVGAKAGDFYPPELRAEIDTLNALIYPKVNNGVYRCGFATTQQAYEEAFDDLFATLDRLEDRLSGRRFLLGERVSEADWRLFTTLVRFDAVYVGHFKCNKRRIADYSALSRYLKELYRWPGIAGTVDIFHIKHHYYASHLMINPRGLVPVGPQLDF
jgi:putative glutathione S-transferase